VRSEISRGRCGDKNDKPVRGGYFRIAAEQYIGKMNPNRWPVLDCVDDYFHERLMMTDSRYMRPRRGWPRRSGLRIRRPS
jgi:hypothetical protein